MLLMLVLSFCTSYCEASFEDSWCKAIENCEAKDFIQAELNFSEAIIKMEESKDNSRPDVYVDRGRLYMLLNRYDEALLDLNKALISPQLVQQERIRGLVSKIITCGNLGLESRSELKELKRLYPNFPKIEETESRVIIKNVPDCECYKNILKSYYIGFGICENESDINIMRSGTCIVNKKSKTCNCKRKQNSTISGLSDSANRVEECEFWCDKLAKAGDVWCGTHFKTVKCQIACIAAVELINYGCHWCCTTGDFHGKCIEPFSDILAKMDSKICTPDWD